MNEISAESLYKRRISDRSCYLDEAERSAKVTIPSIFPDSQDIITRSTPVVLDKPFQSLGARGVNNLASKLLLTLFPPTLPFMKYVLSGEAKDQASEDEGAVTKIRAALARRESRLQDEVDVQNLRTKFYVAIRALLIGGNSLVYMDPVNGGAQVYPLNSYTTVRDGSGNLLDLILVEKMDRSVITDPRVLEILATVPSASSAPDSNTDESEEPVCLYTRVLREGKKYHSWQEVGGQKVPGTEETWSVKDNPWLALRYSAIDGEDYGRGFVEEYRGDLTSYEQLSRDTQFASANAAKVVWAVDPNSPLRPKTLLKAQNGGVISAKEGDVHAIRLDKGADMQFVANEKDQLRTALSASFLLNSSFQRQQERVTAEEVRRMAEELEDTLGGVFSLFSVELQLPAAHLLERHLIKTDKSFGPLPESEVRIGVVTGLAAIGRGQELQRFREFLGLLRESAEINPEIARYLKPSAVIQRLVSGSGVDSEGLLYTEDEVQEQIQAEQQAASAQTTGEEMARGAGNAIGGMPPEQVAEMAAAQVQGGPQ